VNRLPTSPDDFDRSLRQLQQQAEGALSPATLARLRQARQQAGTAGAPWRRRGLWLATAVTVALRFNGTDAPVAAPATVTAAATVDSDDAIDAPLPFDESPELYLWLGSDNLAME
jgi:hypothetical protein